MHIVISKLSTLVYVINIVKYVLDEGAYKSALFCAVSKSDICDQVEYPELDTRNYLDKRYKKWYNENIYPYGVLSHREKFNGRLDNKNCEHRYEFFCRPIYDNGKYNVIEV